MIERTVEMFIHIHVYIYTCLYAVNVPYIHVFKAVSKGLSHLKLKTHAVVLMFWFTSLFCFFPFLQFEIQFSPHNQKKKRGDMRGKLYYTT